MRYVNCLRFAVFVVLFGAKSVTAIANCTSEAAIACLEQCEQCVGCTDPDARKLLQVTEAWC